MKDFEKHLDWFRKSLSDDSINHLIIDRDYRLYYAAGFFYDFPKVVELLDLICNGINKDISFQGIQ